MSCELHGSTRIPCLIEGTAARYPRPGAVEVWRWVWAATPNAFIYGSAARGRVVGELGKGPELAGTVPCHKDNLIDNARGHFPSFTLRGFLGLS